MSNGCLCRGSSGTERRETKKGDVRREDAGLGGSRSGMNAKDEKRSGGEAEEASFS